MKSFNDHRFNAKILLFGEYSLLCGSMALSIPFDQFYGKLAWPEKNDLDPENQKSNEHISRFFDFYLNLFKEKKLNFELDFNRLTSDIKSGLYFKSNIPSGYGLGSSGALVAALFKEYGNHQDVTYFSTSSRLLELKAYFAALESYFHGKSSGLDPLISYLNKAVLFSDKKEIETISLNWNLKDGPGALFLIDSGLPGETQPLVSRFRSNFEDKSFKKSINNHLIPLVNTVITAYTNGEVDSLLAATNEISAFQAKYFDEMIPVSVKGIWRKGLKTNKYSIKLCGSGGGGMMLGFTDDISATKQILGEFTPIIIHHL